MRFHLFEFGDQRWFPQVLREPETAYLAAAYRILPLPRLWAEKMSTLFHSGEPHSGEPCEILDLCSGCGGPMPLILNEFDMRGFQVRARLTDLFPNPKSAAHSRISWVTEPVDATKLPPTLTGVRTMFTAFHHFRPDQAKAILRAAFDSGQAICVFEGGSGTLLGMATMVLVPFNVLALMPFVRPFRWNHFLFTYLIPVIPFVLLWDGIVSMLRIYSPKQMMQMTENMRRPDYSWEIGLIPVRGMPGGLPYLIGRPSML